MAMAMADLALDFVGEDALLDLEIEASGEEGGDVLERACLDVDAPATSFCRVYKVHDRSGKVVGVGHPTSQASPTAAFRDHPSLNVDFALGSVFRGRKRRPGLPTTYFSCFMLSPPFEKEGRVHFVSVTAGHCYDQDVESVEGCFGTATEKDFDGAGFPCPTFPIHLVRTSTVDLAFFEVASDQRDVSFLLPCSPDGCDVVAGFGYPCILTALRKAKEELIDGKENHGVWDAYKSVVGTDSKQELYDMLWDTFSTFRSGDLICSPGRIAEFGEKLQLRTSTLPGNSGGPVMPSWVESQGYFVGIHRSGAQHTDRNFATSTDSVVFVEFYRRSVLPHIPGEEDVIWTGRNMGPFVQWLQKHGLHDSWKLAPVKKRRREQAEDFTTPTTSKSISIGSSELLNTFTP